MKLQIQFWALLILSKLDSGVWGWISLILAIITLIVDLFLTYQND
jgi:hypothetical protein